MVVLYLLGMDINTMTLGGQCIAFGSLVDDAIIDVENVYKRLRQNHRLPEAKRASDFKVVFDASAEIRSSILNATFIIMVTFVPLFFLSGYGGTYAQTVGHCLYRGTGHVAHRGYDGHTAAVPTDADK